MVIVLLADGFEELEALSPVDILRRADIDVKTVGITGKDVTGAHGITVRADLLPEEVERESIDAVIFPGGMPGSLNLDASPYADEFIGAVQKNGGRIAAICAAPLVLGRRGLLNGRRATCFPGFENELVGAVATGESVVTDGNITTARGMGVALDFALELLSLYKGKDVSHKIAKSIIKD